MAYLVKLPPLGEGIFEAQMISVHKQAGDEVKEGDVIAEMETDKAVGVLASPVDGVIEEFYIEQHDYIFRDEKVLLIDDGKSELTTGSGADGGRVSADGSIVAPPEDEKLTSGAKAEDQPVAQTEEAVSDQKEEELPMSQKEDKPASKENQSDGAPEAEQKEEEPEPEDSTPKVQVSEADDNGFQKVSEGEEEYYITDQTGSVREIFARYYGEDLPQPPAAKPDPEFMSQQGQAQQGEPKPSVLRHDDRYLDPLSTNFMHSLDGSQPIPTHIASQLTYEEYLERAQSVKAAPAVREYAAKNSIDLTDLETGGEPVTMEMVDEALRHRVGEHEWNYRLINELDPGYYTNRPDEESGREETYIRKYNASRYEMTHHKVPPFSVQVKVDMTKLQQLLDIVKGDQVDNHAYIPYLIRAIVIAAYRYPELNASLDDVLSVFRFKSYVNVGIEMNTVQGLFTPVVKDADQMSVSELEDRINELEQEVKVDRIFNYETNSESTITITDLSDLGPVESFVPIIHYPDAAILGMANVRDEAVVEDGEIAIRPMMPMTLVIDARILTRDKAVRVINFVKDMLEDPSYLYEMEDQTRKLKEEAQND